MILAAISLALVQHLPTPAEIERLPPAAAGELALVGQEHGPIVAVVRRDGSGMDPPGMVTIELVERAVAGEGGCSRTRWEIVFGVGPDEHVSRRSGPRAGTEVALFRAGACPDDPYVPVGSNVEAPAALDILRHLDEIRSPRRRINFLCSDTTHSHLCFNARTIRREVARLSPWQILRDGDVTILWLGIRGQVVTELRYPAASPDRVTVKREIPPPF
jgi:hypothetical protein